MKFEPLRDRSSQSTGRTPHGVRGLKCLICWPTISARRRTPHGVRGLKCIQEEAISRLEGRTPHGVRGLK